MNSLIQTTTTIAAAITFLAVATPAARGQIVDCNANGVADARELAGNDCNQNGVLDECDPDADLNGVPDDCEGPGVDLDCSEFDRYETLTPNDTLTLITNFHNPELEQGYLVITATDPGGEPIAFNFLTGSSMSVDGLEAFDYSINPVDYRALVGKGVSTDVDLDGIRDLNGIEYERTAGQILIPRFFGQVPDLSRGELLLIGLSGGRQFTTIVDLLVYNDNEEEFSTQYEFRCWARVPLTSISQMFDNDWLRDWTNHDRTESVDGLESGWIRIDGGVANSRVLSIVDPAVYGVYIERYIGNAVADLPFETSLQRGHLLPDSLWGDDEESGGGDQIDGVSIGRRQPGSLLLYPEFDNRFGIVSLITVTNSNPDDEVKVHFSYIGRFGL